MPRAVAHDADAILDAARRLVLEGGARAAGVAAIAAASGAPVGSIYHRFGSRDGLLEELWLRASERFQRAWLAPTHEERIGIDTAAAMAGAVIAFAHTDRADAELLLAMRPRDLFDLQNDHFSARLAETDAVVESELQALARSMTGRVDPYVVERLGFVTIDLPHGALRRHGGRAPPRLELYVRHAAWRLLGDL